MSTATYIYIGLDRARRNTANQAWPDLRKINGFAGLVDRCDEMARVIDNGYKKQDPDDFPGIFDYEVTEELGAWLYHHIEATPTEFQAELARFVSIWTFQL
jgi:hypothetical protein